jgi:hypothetical protein
MKKIFKIAIGLAAVALTFTGCKKFLTQVPLDASTIQNYFRSKNDLDASITAMYASFQHEMTGAGTSSTWGKYMYWGEGRSDNLDRSGYANSISTELSLNGITQSDDATDWSGLYRTIARANTCIKYIPQIPKYDPKVTQDDVNNALAQAYAMRAECYFYIIRLWGDAPIWTEPYDDVSKPAAKARSSVSAVMDSVIIPDLDNAYSLITKNKTADVWYIGEAGICAIAANVAMWQHDYQGAVDWIQKLFQAKGPTGKIYGGTSQADLTPTADWKNLFIAPDQTTENIWSINWDYSLNGCACLVNSIYYNNSPVEIDSIVRTDWPMDLEDIRSSQTIDPTVGYHGYLSKYYPNSVVANKWKPVDDVKALPVYLVMYRLGGIYLLYAEALNYLGQTSQAVTYLNYVRTRAGHAAYQESDFANADAVEDSILNERRWELFGEGSRWFDLVRTGRVNKIMDPVMKIRQEKFGIDPVGFGSNADKILWPINQQVLENNPLLKQNPSY